MGLQDWLEKAAPAAALLKGGNHSQGIDSANSGFFGGLGESSAPTISRFTGLPVTPSRLNLALNHAPEEQETPQEAPPHTPAPSPIPESFTVDTDDLTDFHPLYPEPSPQPLEYSTTMQAASFTTEAFTPLQPPVAEDFYVAPAEAFTAEAEPNQSSFAWPNADNEDEDIPNLSFSENHWGVETAPENDTTYDFQPLQEPLSPQPFSEAEDDPFGLNDFSHDPSSTLPPESEDPFASLTTSSNLSTGVETQLDDFGLEPMTLIEPNQALLEISHTPLPAFDDDYDPFTSGPLDNDIFGEATLPESFPLALDDLHPLYPTDEHGILSPSLIVEPPDADTLSLDWEAQQPWATHVEGISPLDDSPLHLLDAINAHDFASDWELTLPELPDDFTPASEPFNHSLDETHLELFSEEAVVESAHPWPNSSSDDFLMPQPVSEPVVDNWQGFDAQDSVNILAPAAPFHEDTMAASTAVEDEDWLHNAVADDFLVLSQPDVPPQAPFAAQPHTRLGEDYNRLSIAQPSEQPFTQQVSEEHTSALPPLAQAVTKNGRMTLILVPDGSGQGFVLQALALNPSAKGPEPQTLSKPHVLKRFTKNPLDTGGSFGQPSLTVTEEARLKGKTLYRVELGPWRGIFSHSERNGIVFQDEWHSEL